MMLGSNLLEYIIVFPIMIYFLTLPVGTVSGMVTCRLMTRYVKKLALFPRTC
jgi:hypothetical protein